MLVLFPYLIYLILKIYVLDKNVFIESVDKMVKSFIPEESYNDFEKSVMLIKTVKMCAVVCNFHKGRVVTD